MRSGGAAVTIGPACLLTRIFGMARAAQGPMS